MLLSNNYLSSLHIIYRLNATKIEKVFKNKPNIETKYLTLVLICFVQHELVRCIIMIIDNLINLSSRLENTHQVLSENPFSTNISIKFCRGKTWRSTVDISKFVFNGFIGFHNLNADVLRRINYKTSSQFKSICTISRKNFI